MNTQNVKVELYDQGIWNEFHEKTNEMIINKQGRTIFPRIRIGVSGLEPNGDYSISLELQQSEDRWKFSGAFVPGGSTGEWNPCK